MGFRDCIIAPLLNALRAWTRAQAPLFAPSEKPSEPSHPSFDQRLAPTPATAREWPSLGTCQLMVEKELDIGRSSIREPNAGQTVPNAGSR